MHLPVAGQGVKGTENSTPWLAARWQRSSPRESLCCASDRPTRASAEAQVRLGSLLSILVIDQASGALEGFGVAKKKKKTSKRRPAHANVKNSAVPGWNEPTPKRALPAGTQPAWDNHQVSNPFEKPQAPVAVTGSRPSVMSIAAPVSSGSALRTTRQSAETPRVALEEHRVPTHDCATGVLSQAEPQGVAATYAFDTTNWTTTGPVAISFSGTRLDGSDGPGDRFERIERIGELGPQAGKVTITTRLGHVTPGQWRIVAGPVENSAGHPLSHEAIITSSQFAVLAQGPGVRLFAWPVLVGFGAVVALLLQILLVGRADLPVLPVLAITGLGCVIGFLGGKVWWLVVNRRPPRDFLSSGACIQGFLLVALAALVAGAQLLGMPAGAILDLTAPGIFFGMAVGRPGCFLTGCCVGRPTTSRWGVWSSDRRLGIRRIPVQLYESAAALLIGVAGLVVVLGVTPPFSGAVFTGAIAAYTLARQSLFRLRSNAHTRLGRLVVQLVCGGILVGVLIAYLTT